MRATTSSTRTGTVSRGRPASAKVLPGAHKPRPPREYTVDEILLATARGEELPGNDRRPHTGKSRISTSQRAATLTGKASTSTARRGGVSGQRKLGEIPPVYGTRRGERLFVEDTANIHLWADNTNDESILDYDHHRAPETFHTGASGQSFDVQRLQLHTPPRALLHDETLSPEDSPEGTHWDTAPIACDELPETVLFAITPPTVPRLNVGAAIKNAGLTGDAWARPGLSTCDATPERCGISQRLFAYPGEQAAPDRELISRRAGTAQSATGPTAWPDQASQREALARKRQEQRQMLDEQRASARVSAVSASTTAAIAVPCISPSPGVTAAPIPPSSPGDAQLRELEAEARRAAQQRYRAELDLQVAERHRAATAEVATAASPAMATPTATAGGDRPSRRVFWTELDSAEDAGLAESRRAYRAELDEQCREQQKRTNALAAAARAQADREAQAEAAAAGSSGRGEAATVQNTFNVAASLERADDDGTCATVPEACCGTASHLALAQSSAQEGQAITPRYFAGGDVTPRYGAAADDSTPEYPSSPRGAGAEGDLEEMAAQMRRMHAELARQARTLSALAPRGQAGAPSAAETGPCGGPGMQAGPNGAHPRVGTAASSRSVQSSRASQAEARAVARVKAAGQARAAAKAEEEARGRAGSWRRRPKAGARGGTLPMELLSRMLNAPA